MKIRNLAVTLLVGGLALTACGREGGPGDGGNEPVEQDVATDVVLEGSPTFDAMQERGTVNIGVKEDQPGLGLLDPTTGEYSGFDVEIARLIAAELGFDPNEDIEYQAIPSASREQAIANGQVDYYVGTYTINDGRKEQIDFAGPYYQAGQDLLIRQEDAEEITGPDTLMGKVVCSATGSTPIQRVRDEGLTEEDNIREFQLYSECVEQLRIGEVDAVTTDDAILLGYAAENSDELTVVGEQFSEEPYGIGLPLDDEVLRNAINDILDESRENGKWQEIYDATLGQSGSTAEQPEVERY
ncbi:glutamate ABC transporter substrate-binding protein [Actinoalloteichus hymeniacidonis]|uniref:Periplasmic component of amino acid ABC-type transporter/signal transduction system n=1 Tax=Actinoalloteichus hymeniacidonis TaxID=340345 RepID=A0AAC9MXQ5_9PSEU|nr:glutamate ABC transporter substrate-binding protein [Actinoalloteichus hymeniacidonis]AOS62520.1 periplasmic component of amino acid ABC-type transporter/signal transduction system [Actinoalloteichus hymeniacidonis]MBB5909449.1 glutamate transport system substrate-binding protein [Actinoalloteichus hymeniacidonis]